MEYIIILLGSAIIGYSTNWLAIKMLFRPYKKHKILGVKVPFTPGLIPKERERIAEKIGEAVGDYILTENVLVNELTSETVENSIIKAIRTNCNNINQNNLTVDGFTKTILLEEKDNSLSIINTQIYNFIAQQLKDEDNKENISNFITKSICDELMNISLNDIINLSDKGIDSLANYFHGDNFKKCIKEVILNKFEDDKKVVELVGENVINQIKGVVAYNIPEITKYIQSIASKEEVKIKAKEQITKIVSEKFGALGSMFVNADSIYELIELKVNEMLEDDENKEKLRLYLNNAIEDIANKSVYEVVPENTRSEIIQSGIEKISEKLSDKKVLLDFINKFSYNSLNENILDFTKKSFEIDTECEIKKIVISKLEDLSSDENSEFIKSIINDLAQKILKNNIQLSENLINKVEKISITHYENIVKTKSKEIISTINIKSIIEKEINAFKVEEMEELILSIARKELRAITWIGALIGFLMGIILCFN